MMSKKSIFSTLVLSFSLSFVSFSWSDDYKSAQKFSDGDVVSAQVLNDILDRIELTLKGITPSELVGTWSVTWRTCTNGGPGNCSGLDAGTGWTSNVDDLYRTRDGTWTFSDDSDGTFSVSMDKCVVGVTNGSYFNDPCVGRVAVDSGIFLFGWESGPDNYFRDSAHSEMYNIKRISSSRFTIWKLSSGSQSFVSFTLDKNNLPPEAPANLALSISSSSITQSWTAVSGASSYDIHRKTTATGSFASIGTATTESYSDTSVTSGATYWYRVFAKNANGTSSGSNVIKLTFNPSAALSSSSIGITDYINGIASSESEHKLFYRTESNTMTANLDVGQLDAENLNGLLAGSGGISPVLKFTLANVPSAGMSGTAKLTSKVLDGGNATLTIGERAISTTTDVDWSSDGEKLLLTVPNQTVEVILTGSGGTSIVGNWSVGGSSDLMTITSSGINKPVTLDVKLLEFLSSNIGATGPSITNFFTEGTYFYDIKIAGIGLMDSQGNTFNNVQGAFGVDSNPGTVAYIDDVAVSEEFDMATILVTLSTPSSEAVTLNYDTSGDSATSGEDYTASSGSLRIAAGNKVGAFTIPLTNDSYNESNEIFSVSLSNISNATLARTTAKVTIIDNDVSS